LTGLADVLDDVGEVEDSLEVVAPELVGGLLSELAGDFEVVVVELVAEGLLVGAEALLARTSYTIVDVE